MSARFGRNQRRKMREEITLIDNERRIARGQLVRAEQRVLKVQAECDEAIYSARMARDTIRIDIDSLVDDRERNINMRARFDNMSKCGPELYSAMKIDSYDIMRQSDTERRAFTKLVGERIAEHALQQIMRHWRSR